MSFKKDDVAEKILFNNNANYTLLFIYTYHRYNYFNTKR